MKLEGGGDDCKLIVDDDGFDACPVSSPDSGLRLCRICHEEEDESSTSMENPCTCSGTLKFAHRSCVQRWCDEKGSIICEICLQKFEPGYTVPPKLALLDIAVTIRGSLEVPRLNYESHNTGFIDDEESDSDYPECSPPSDRTTVCFRFLAVAFMFMLLVRHLILVLSSTEDQYPFAIAIVLMLRASGILLPFYFILRIITVIQNGQMQHQRRIFIRRRDGPQMQREGEDEEPQHTVIQIQS